MTHYAQYIHQYGSADNVNTEHSETAHKHLMKVFYNWMNKWENFQEQLLNHNFHHLKILAMEDLILWNEMQDSRISNNTMLAFVTQSSWALSLKKICGVQSWRERKQVQCVSLNVKEWCSVSALNFTLNISELLDVLAVFVHNCWNVMNEISITDNDLNQRAKDISNVELYNVCVHSLLKCWKQHEKNIHDLESLVSEKVYCASNWQNKVEYWRHDCVLVQKWSDNIRDSLNLFND